ncbi:MAG TPA: FHA domain-containing protein [Phycisphaerales bacterium]|nr:FHA domain-containing protein [Phycisphaerales bacterium]
MRLVVKQKDGTAREFQFDGGPVSIGRAADSHVLLPDRAVSRQHARLMCDEKGCWLVEDLDSASKTFVNDRAVHRMEIKHGDCIRITDFLIDVALEETPPLAFGSVPIDAGDTIHIEAALSTPVHETVVRKPDAGHAPAMRLDAHRLMDFAAATEKICGAAGFDELLLTLLDVTMEQFSAFHVWAALRTSPAGPMTFHAGRKDDGSRVELGHLPLQQKIIQAVEKAEFLVLPRVAADLEEHEAIRSALIAAIVRPDGCYGVLYVDNSMKAKHYSLSDLDYLMLLAMHTAAVMKRVFN